MAMPGQEAFLLHFILLSQDFKNLLKSRKLGAEKEREEFLIIAFFLHSFLSFALKSLADKFQFSDDDDDDDGFISVNSRTLIVAKAKLITYKE